MTVRDEVLGGRYRLVRQIGEGGMGQVWEAQDETLGRPVALKEISLLAGGGSRGEESRARFLREARITARLQHPNIVTIHDLGETGAGDAQVPFLVMELVRGEGLDRMLRRGAVTLADAVRWGAQIGDALAEAHDAGILHRDIKPSNVLITPTGIVKVLDFGVARAADPGATADRLTQTGFIVGTPPYMAPEQARGFPEPRSDLYGLGCLLFELITGRLPFRAPDTVGYLSAHLTQEPPAPSSVSPGIPAAWDALLLALLDKDPAQRPPDAAGLSRALRRLTPGPTRPEAELAPAKREFGTTIPPSTAATGSPEDRKPEDRKPEDRDAGTPAAAPARRSGGTTAAMVMASVTCLLAIPVWWNVLERARNARSLSVFEAWGHITVCGLQTALLAAGVALLLRRVPVGGRFISVGGNGMAFLALLLARHALGLGFLVVGLVAVTAVLSSILARVSTLVPLRPRTR
ncbi:protein kinase [Streptomyces sp. NPDC058045]|uniref:serine/threonine-protein kinase n=1 Tax=Streptomyces sp. NPDC058045 TaxID=3346311 RepID=UPI0036E4EC25